MFISKTLKNKIVKIAKEYAEENNCFWGDENDFFIYTFFFFSKDYLVYNKKSVMESDYSVTIKKKTLKPYKISPFGNQKPNAKDSTKNYEN